MSQVIRIEIVLLIIAVMIVLSSFSSTQVATAQTTTTETLHETELETVETERAHLHTSQDDRPPVLSEQRRTRIINLAANTSTRTEATITRLSRIADRLERRMIKIQTEGKTTASAEQAMEAARTNLADATQIMESIDDDVHRFVHSYDPRTQWDSVRTIYNTAHQAIRNAHVSLRIAVNELESASPRTTTTDDI